jgi:hypothetical protein
VKTINLFVITALLINLFSQLTLHDFEYDFNSDNNITYQMDIDGDGEIEFHHQSHDSENQEKSKKQKDHLIYYNFNFWNAPILLGRIAYPTSFARELNTLSNIFRPPTVLI